MLFQGLRRQKCTEQETQNEWSREVSPRPSKIEQENHRNLILSSSILPFESWRTNPSALSTHSTLWKSRDALSQLHRIAWRPLRNPARTLQVFLDPSGTGPLATPGKHPTIFFRPRLLGPKRPVCAPLCDPLEEGLLSLFRMFVLVETYPLSRPRTDKSKYHR